MFPLSYHSMRPHFTHITMIIITILIWGAEGSLHPEITIKTLQKNGKRLLLIKDSFANAFVPFLLNDYEAIHILDLRYFKGSVDDYIHDNQIDE